AVLKTSRGAGVAGGRAGAGGGEEPAVQAKGAGRAVVGEPAGQGRSRRRRGSGVAEEAGRSRAQGRRRRRTGEGGGMEEAGAGRRRP
ncbi:hypothetical protein E2562_008511, partial [Oryza meyeriana var. granulata]